MAKKTIVRTFIFGFLILSFNQYSFSESEQRVGKLENGKAYRIDKYGSKIVDYIAELELRVLELKREVLSLREELEDKNKLISKSKLASNSEVIKEESLIKSNQEDASKNLATINSLKAQVRKERDKNLTLSSRLKEIEIENSALVDEIEKDKLKEAEELEIAKTVVVKEEKLEPEISEPKILKNQEQVNLANSNPKTDISSRLERVQSLILERKNFIDSLTTKSKNPRVFVSRLVTKDGYSLDYLRSHIFKEESIENKLKFINGLKEIEGILESDLSKLRTL